MKSLHARLDHQKDAVLRVTESYGPWRAMDLFQVSDYVCFRDWLKEATGNEQFGLNPKIRLDGRQTLGDQVVEKFLRTVLDLKDQLKEKNERIAFLEWQLASDGSKDELQALAVMQVCEA